MLIFIMQTFSYHAQGCLRPAMLLLSNKMILLRHSEFWNRSVGARGKDPFSPLAFGREGPKFLTPEKH